MASAKRSFPLLLALVLVLGVGLHFCLWKSGMFIDEIYTYGLSNSHDMPFIGHGEDDRIAEQLLTREDFFDYLAVTDGEPRFDPVSVYDNQVRDVHPPLYYWLLNFCSGLAEGRFSKWIGLVPNLLIHLGTCALLYMLARKLGAGPEAAGVTALLYGVSTVGLSTMLMIRMYVLMTFWTVLLAGLAVDEVRAPGPRTELRIGLTIFAGLMTQYYFVFYACFLCAGVLVMLRRRWRDALRFAVFAFAGVGLMLLVFPAALSHLTTGGNDVVSGSHALSQMLQVAAWPGRLRYYFGQIWRGLTAAALAGAASVLVLIFSGRRSLRGEAWRELLLLTVPVLPTVALAAVMSPVLAGRYIYSIMPVCVLAAGWCLSLMSGRVRAVALTLTAALAFTLGITRVPEYIYEEHRSYTELAAEHAEEPCVYLTGYYAGVTQDMLQLMEFGDVYVTEDPGSDGLREYLGGSGARVVFVDVNGYWGSGLQPEEVLPVVMEAGDYTEAEPMYEYALSECWALKR